MPNGTRRTRVSLALLESSATGEVTNQRNHRDDMELDKNYVNRPRERSVRSCRGEFNISTHDSLDRTKCRLSRTQSPEFGLSLQRMKLFILCWFINPFEHSNEQNLLKLRIISYYFKSMYNYLLWFIIRLVCWLRCEVSG